MCARVITWETDWRVVDRNLVEAVVSECARFIVASCVLPLILRYFLRSLAGVLVSVKS